MTVESLLRNFFTTSMRRLGALALVAALVAPADAQPVSLVTVRFKAQTDADDIALFLRDWASVGVRLADAPGLPEGAVAVRLPADLSGADLALDPVVESISLRRSLAGARTGVSVLPAAR